MELKVKLIRQISGYQRIMTKYDIDSQGIPQLTPKDMIHRTLEELTAYKMQYMQILNSNSCPEYVFGFMISTTKVAEQLMPYVNPNIHIQGTAEIMDTLKDEFEPLIEQLCVEMDLQFSCKTKLLLLWAKIAFIVHKANSNKMGMPEQKVVPDEVQEKFSDL